MQKNSNRTSNWDGRGSSESEPKRGGGQRSHLRWLRAAFWVAAMAVVLSAGQVRAADFVIVVDVSGSMADPISRQDKRVRVSVVQDALRNYLPALPPGSRVNLVAFNSGIVSEEEITLTDDGATTRALSWVEGLSKKTGRETHLWTTLRHALQTAARYSQDNPDQPVTVRVLTDGEDNERATTLDKVLQEFQPVLDGEKIRGNLVLLGDLEFKTKLTLPDGAFEMTKNPTWEVIFPPIVLWAPTEPRIGDEVRLFENTTKSVYKDYQWQVDGVSVGQEKVLVWRFKEPRTYRVTLKVAGLQGTQNSATVLLRVNEPDKLAVDFVPSAAQPAPGEEVRFIGRCSGKDVQFTWFVNSNQVATSQDLVFRFDKEGKQEIKLTTHNAAGSTGIKVQTLVVKEPAITAGIKGPAETITGRAAQFAGEIVGPCASVEWDFGDGTTSVERNPQHTFLCEGAEHKDYAVTLRAVSPSGKATQANAHTVRVWAEKKVPAPQAAFRVLAQRLRVGDPIQVMDETVGAVENVQWAADGVTRGSVRNPELVFSTPGEKTITLTVRGLGGESVVTKKVVVQPRFAQPVVWCGASPLKGSAPLYVQFTNRITGDFKSLLWSFGDGQTSTVANPGHLFLTSHTNYAVSLTVHPMDGTQDAVQQRIVVKTGSFWPLWRILCLAIGIPLIALGCIAGRLAAIRYEKRLRLPVYYWAEQSPACRTVVLTKPNEAVELSPEPIRIRRDGDSQNLTIEPTSGATLFAASGQESAVLSVGDGIRITVKAADGIGRAVAISARQKPSRPEPAFREQPTADNGDVCGLLGTSGEGSAQANSEEFDWGWNGSTTKAG